MRRRQRQPIRQSYSIQPFRAIAFRYVMTSNGWWPIYERPHHGVDDDDAKTKRIVCDHDDQSTNANGHRYDSQHVDSIVQAVAVHAIKHRHERCYSSQPALLVLASYRADIVHYRMDVVAFALEKASMAFVKHMSSTAVDERKIREQRQDFRAFVASASLSQMADCHRNVTTMFVASRAVANDDDSDAVMANVVDADRESSIDCYKNELVQISVTIEPTVNGSMTMTNSRWMSFFYVYDLFVQ